MKKKVIIFTLLLCGVHIYSMEKVLDKPQTTATTPHIVIDISPSDEKNTTGVTAVDKISNLVSGNSGSQGDSALGKSGQGSRSQVPNLSLSTSPLTRAMSASIPKTPIKKAHELPKHINKVAQSARTPIPTNRTPDFTQSGALDQMSDDIGGKNYSEQEVWSILEKLNSVLYKFALENNLSLEQTLMFGELKSRLDISPEAVVDFIKKKLPDDKKVADWNQPGKYKKIQKNDPQKYKEIIFEVMKAVMDEEEGGQKASPLADTHIQLAEEQINTQDSTIKKQWLGIAASAAGLVLTIAWALWQTIGSHVSAPTASPTQNPTNIPTMMPTGAPT